MHLSKRTLLKIFGIIVVLIFIAIVADAVKLTGLKVVEGRSGEYNLFLDGKSYVMIYRPEEALKPYFGKARNEFGTEYVLVRDDLPKSAKKFIMYHELYHFQDKSRKNVILREIHANLGAMPYSFIGFIQTSFLTLTDAERMKYYFSLIF